jgi:SAM-dependent methyltransferase
VIRRFLHHNAPRTDRAIDLGSGRTNYGLDAIHVDFVLEAVRDAGRGVVGDIRRLPLRSSQVDVVWCVGSVVNYVPLFETIGEVARILRPGGTFILEYERLRRPGLLSPERVTYQGTTHVIWTYADEYVEAALSRHGFVVCGREFFHVLSGVSRVVLRNAAAPLARLDAYASRVRMLRKRAANAIVRTRRVAA